MHRSKIEWVLNPNNKTLGWIWNPITGCLNHNNGLCKGGGFPCYAYKLANGRLKQRYRANKNTAPQVGPVSFRLFPEHPFYPRFWDDRMLDVPIKNYEPNKHLGFFCCDMSDLFGIGVPEEWTRRVLTKIRTGGAWHRFYLLTKQPQNLIKFSPFPPNCYVGFTATDNKMLQYGLAYISEIEAKIKYVSFEPLLGQIVFPTALDQLDWVIIGQQTPVSDKTRPKPEWISEIIQAANKASIPVFIKNNILNDEKLHWSNQENWNRQELPE